MKSAREPAPPVPNVPVEDAWFATNRCRNCGAERVSAYCGGCGQKAAVRLVWRDVWRETWDRVRYFELLSAKTLARLILSPGRTAREYVMGRRAAHMHPLKLLVALVAILVLVLAASQYFSVYDFSGRNSDVDRMAQRVVAYANWSFSLGIVAIFVAAGAVFWRRLGYNAIELAVLAVYCQNLILAVIIANLLPTVIWHSPEFILWHKNASQYYLYAIKLAIVTVAYCQFFLLDLRRDWLRLLAACLIYVGISWLLLRAYAFAIFWLVS
jgi:hypothetical protein